MTADDTARIAELTAEVGRLRAHHADSIASRDAARADARNLAWALTAARDRCDAYQAQRDEARAKCAELEAVCDQLRSERDTAAVTP